MVVGDDREGVVFREGDDLGHEHALPRFPELAREGVGADEGDVDEDRIESEPARPADEQGDRPVGADDHDRLGPAVAQVEHRRLHGQGVALVRADPRELQLAPLEGAAEARVAREPVRIVLVEDPDPGQPEVARQPLDHLVGLLEVGGADVEHHGAAPAAQELRPRERADVGHAGGRRDGLGGVGGRGADRPDEGEYALLLDEPAGVADRAIRLVRIVEGDQLELAPVHPARAVALLEGGLDPEPHAPPEGLRRARERGGLAEQDAVFAHPRNVVGGAARRRRGREGGEHRTRRERARRARSGRETGTLRGAHGHDPRFLVRVRQFFPPSWR